MTEQQDTDVMGNGSIEPGEMTSSVAATLYSFNQIQRVRDLLARFYGARKTVHFYASDHPASEATVAGLFDALDRFFREGVDVEIALYESELHFGQQFLPEESVIFDQLIRDLMALGVGSIVFRRGLTVSELTRGVSIMATDAHSAAIAGGLPRMLSEAQVTNISVGTVKALRTIEKSNLTPEDARASYDDAIGLLREVDHLISRNRTVNGAMVRGFVRSLVDNVVSNRYAMLELAGLKSYDEYTYYHCANVAILSLALGSTLTQDSRFLVSLGTGALLHDIGKMSISLDLLNKPGPLTAEEWTAIKNHPVAGAIQAASIPGLDKAALVIILEHHQRYDGNGYPNVTNSRPQHLASRIVAVADAFDAMTSRRAYSSARTAVDAMQILAESGDVALDPTLTRLFTLIMGIYPPRSVVRLSDSRVGIVLRPSTHDLLKPVVKVITEQDGTMVDGHTVDLSSESGLAVTAVLDPHDLNIDVSDYL